MIHYDATREFYDAFPALNQSLVKKFMKAASPKHFKWEIEHQQDSKAMKLGRGIDTLISAPEKMDQLYAVPPEKYTNEKGEEKDWHSRATVCKAWKEAQLASGREIITRAEWRDIQGMAIGLSQNKEAANLILNSKKQVMAECVHPTLGYPMKALADFFIAEDSEWIFDQKSCFTCGPDFLPHAFSSQCRYDIQAAFYLDVFRWAGCKNLRYFGFIVVESEAPFDCDIHWIDAEKADIADARGDYEQAMVRYMKHKEANHWPGHASPDGKWRELIKENWMRRRQLKALPERSEG